MTTPKKISLDFGGLSGKRVEEMAAGTLENGGYDSALESILRELKSVERGREVTSKVEQLQKEATWAGAVQPLLDGIMARDGHFKGRKIILAIDELHAQIPAQKMKAP
jgi:hypothetical protein